MSINNDRNPANEPMYWEARHDGDKPMYWEARHAGERATEPVLPEGTGADSWLELFDEPAEVTRAVFQRTQQDEPT